jgi:hypothetical protein
MKRFLVSFAILLTFAAPFGLTLANAGAVDIFTNCGKGTATTEPDVCTDANSQTGDNGTNNPIIHAIAVAINILSIITGIAAVIGIVISGLRFVLSNGDSNAIASARSGVVYALIGIVVTVSAQVIVIFVLDKIK